MYQNKPIVATIDYSSLLREQSSLVERGMRKINFYIQIKIPLVLTIAFAGWFIKRLNAHLSKQLLFSQGSLANLQQDFKTLKGSDLNLVIKDLNVLNLLNIDFHSHIERAMERGLDEHLKGLCNLKSLLEETIDVQYDIIRLLKRANKVIPMQTTELAKSISAHSFENLQKVTHGG